MDHRLRDGGARRRRQRSCARRSGGATRRELLRGRRRTPPPLAPQRRHPRQRVARRTHRSRDRRVALTKGRSVIYELLYPLSREFGWASMLNVLRYVPFRIIMATITAMVMSFVLAPWFIRELQKKQIGQVVRKDGPESHHIKAGTPTMGGALILLSVLVPTMLWADVRNTFVVATAAVTAGYGLIGYVDDRLKITARNTRGLPGRYKLLGQTLIASLALIYVFTDDGLSTPDWTDIKYRLSIPFLAFSKVPIELPAWLYISFAVFVVVAMSNGVNLTDGLDGL